MDLFRHTPTKNGKKIRDYFWGGFMWHRKHLSLKTCP
jgi:hypothetical protein